MKNLLFCLALLLAVLPMSAPAEEKISLETVVRAVEAPFRADTPRAAAIRDFEAEFVQESRLASLDRSQRGRGRVAVQFDRTDFSRAAAAKFRWDYEEPAAQHIVSDGRNLWVYLPENRQVMQSEIDQLGEDRPDDPMTFLTGLGNLSRDFQIAWGAPPRDAEGNFVLELTPRRPSPLLQSLQVVVDRQAVPSRPGKGGVFPLRSVTVVDPVGNSTAIAFRNVRVNRGLAAELFRFEPPPGIEVVRPAGQPLPQLPR